MVNLKIDNVDCFYDSVKILENISFSVSTGTFLGILGPNGSGKTTLLKSISRVLKPRKGAIALNSVDIYDMKTTEVAKQMAVVPQESAMGFSFTVLEVVLMGRTPHLSRLQREAAKDYAIAKRAMEYTRTWSFADRLITELSGGERQRVIIARALTQEPAILLLDEPTSHLDICNQLDIMDLLKQLCTEKKMLIVGVFHDFNLAARYCDSIIMLKQGKVVAAGSVMDTLTRENIKEVFGIDTIVNKHPVTNLPFIIPISKPKDQPQKNLSVHLICGAGTGSMLMKTLTDAGYTVTAGVLNLRDTDHETAHLLNIELASEAPLSPISDAAHKANLELIERADAVILTSVPFGRGNLRNLDAAKVALHLGIPTFLIDEVSAKDRDFTKGQASALLSELRSLGGISVKDPKEVLHMLSVSEDKLKAKEGENTVLEHLKPKDDVTVSHITGKNENETE
jgi:iron complex transport system ATP-binding protein